LQRQIIDNGREADPHLKRMRDDQQNYAANLDGMAKNFTEAELKALRKHEPITQEMFGKIRSHVLEMAAFLFMSHPHFTELPAARELPYTFIFRYAIAGYLVALRWISVGGAKSAKPEKIRNDIVDAAYAAYATYFQGLLSGPARVPRPVHRYGPTNAPSKRGHGGRSLPLPWVDDGAFSRLPSSVFQPLGQAPGRRFGLACAFYARNAKLRFPECPTGSRLQFGSNPSP
jgi:hypothetical protein